MFEIFPFIFGGVWVFVLIIIIILFVLGCIYVVKESIEKEKIETFQTNMLLIQGKVKVISHLVKVEDATAEEITAAGKEAK